MALDPKRTGGVDFSEFNPSPHGNYRRGLIYYKNGILTDKYFIKNVGIYDDVEMLTPENYSKDDAAFIYVFNPKSMKIGTYITTGPVKGVGFACPNKELAFAKVTLVIENEDREHEGDIVGGALVKFL